MRYALPPLVGARPAVRSRKKRREATEPKSLTERKSMPKEDDLEGQQDQGGKHGGQAGMPPPAAGGSLDQGIVRKRGEEQPRDKVRPQQVSRKCKADEPPAS
jgi:hypothetical protein